VSMRSWCTSRIFVARIPLVGLVNAVGTIGCR